MIYNPIKGYRNEKSPAGDVTQWFGENPALYMAACKLKSHNGIDIVAPWGTPVYAVEDGVVVETKTDPSGYGMHVRFLSKNKEWTYGHLSMIDVKGSQVIKAGQQIGLMGNTGFVVSDVDALGYWVKGSNKYSGTHLHLSCRDYTSRTSSWKYTTGEKGINVKNYNNGWNGCYDFSDQFYEDKNLGDAEIIKRELEAPKKTYASDDPVWWANFLNLLKFLRLNSK
jgi:murein DD-endopeptidase MepM/ murein hydrolase activator NlpD